MRRSAEELTKDLDSLCKLLTAKPRTMAELVDRFEVDRRTIYRWFDRVGYVMVESWKRPTKYRRARLG